MLNNPSLAKSVVGRTVNLLFLAIVFPLYAPHIIRTRIS